MNQLLASLNQIWRIRENKIETKLKNKYQAEIDRLKREKLMKGEYDGVQAKKSLARTRSLLKQSENKLKICTEKLKKAQNLPAGADVINEALITVTTIQEEKRLLMEENEELKIKFEEIEELRK
jgi:hypothetical protein